MFGRDTPRDDLATQISNRFIARARQFRNMSRFVKIAFVALASALVSFAQFMEWPATGPTLWQVVGIAGSIIVAAGAIFVVFTEDDAGVDLALAREGLERVRLAEQLFEEIEGRDATLERTIELYSAMLQMRAVVEHIAAAPVAADAGMRALMDAAGRSLSIAAGFAQSDQWTITVYHAVIDPATARAELVCVAHRRAIECDISQARRWPEGIGTAGICYSNRRELIVPDLHQNGVGTMFNTGDRARDYDAERYRSVVAIPIATDGGAPWGVVAASNDRPYHFRADEIAGVKTVEAVRALAAMAALVVAVCNR